MAAGEDIGLIATVITILFSTAVLGWALLYKCTDATMVPNDFTLDKCFTFFPEAEKANKSVAEVNVEGQDLFAKSTSLKTGQDEKEDEYYAYISNFKEMDTRIYGTDYTDIAARTIGECAKICFEKQVPVVVNGSECGGFISEYKDVGDDNDRVYCRLYPKGNLSDSTLPSYDKRSFYLKNTQLTRI